jgi:hypothetical protein
MLRVCEGFLSVLLAELLRPEGRISPFPMVWQPLVDLADRRGRQVGQQLRQVTLRIDAVPAAGAGQAAEDRRSVATNIVSGYEPRDFIND